MTGITVIIVILVPVAFQIFWLQIKQNRRHDEIMDTLRRLEEKLESGK